MREPGKFKIQYKKVERGTLKLGESEKFHEAGSPGVENFSRREQQFLRHFQEVPESLRRGDLQVFRELDLVFGTMVRISG